MDSGSHRQNLTGVGDVASTSSLVVYRGCTALSTQGYIRGAHRFAFAFNSTTILCCSAGDIPVTARMMAVSGVLPR